MIQDENETIDNFHPNLLEYPFVRQGMTVKEYWEERNYWGSHLNEVKAGTYEPLWKQRLKKGDDKV